MAASPRVRLIGTQSEGFSKWILYGVIVAVVAIIVALTWWKLGYERQQHSIIEAYRTETTAQIVRRCGNDVQCARLEMRRSFGSADAFARSLQDETADWTFLLLLLGIATGGLSILGLIWIRASLLAAREANSINAAAIMTSERAWVFSRVVTEQQLRFEHDDEIAYLDIQIVNKNAGKSAAINVHTNVACSDGDHIHEVMDQLARDSLKFDSSEFGVLLAPGDEYAREWLWADHDDIGIKFNRSVRFIVGCVTYETLFDDEKHQTGFVFSIDAPERMDGPAILRPWAGSFAT
ncbi:hypothetical protein HFN99_01010 [Rhizobium laguerreae]|uniref:hypothetical protein n=1 Tax=Rhizobium laguerreae TaxID=1076926 RepID=UPI001C924918|nr:hypothetical protein [Rhizobium laguerreae]MBY3335512.1 hypothetical protein [Rhizobium laguerreae]